MILVFQWMWLNILAQAVTQGKGKDRFVWFGIVWKVLLDLVSLRLFERLTSFTL